MAIKLVPYNNAMRLGQGFNSYTQQICIDDAVVIDPERGENVVTNDGTTMRIIAERSALPSAWSRQAEVITDKRADEPINRFMLKQYANELEEQESDERKFERAHNRELEGIGGKGDESKPMESQDDVAKDGKPKDGKSEAEEIKDNEPKAEEDSKEPEQTERSLAMSPDVGSDSDGLRNGENGEEKAAPSGDPIAAEEIALDSDSGEHITRNELDEPVHHGADATEVVEEVAGDEETGEPIDDLLSDVASTVPDAVEGKSSTSNTRKPADQSSHESSKPTRSQIALQRAANRLRAEAAKKKEGEKEQEELRQKEREEFRKAEVKRIEEQRRYDEELAKEAREEEHTRRNDERAEQQAIRAEKQNFDAKRRAGARSAIEAAAASVQAKSLEELKKIAAQNQFAERFMGMIENQHQYTFNATGARGPSQTVTYSSRFV